MTNKLIVVIMGPGKKHFAEMCLESVKDADKILYWTNNKEFIFKNEGKIENLFYNNWDETDPATNGKCRQRYLKHLKQNYPDDWCLVLDEDEVVEDLSKIKEFIQGELLNNVFSVKMRHFIGNIGWEDATHEHHWVPNRLFKISEVLSYPLHSHPVLIPKDENKVGLCAETTIWHCGHLPIEYMDYILKRYKQHTNDSVIHSEIFLNQWKMSHLFGQYPIRQINPLELPKQICERYEINKDEFYHSRYQLELKHSIMVHQWNDYFKPTSVLDLGCGRGCYLFFWKWFVEETKGLEISEWAQQNAFCNKDDILVIDITTINQAFEFDLITAIDILEHLDYKDLDNVLNMMQKTGKKFLFSIPFIGDPNLEADNTHIIKEDKEWWVNKLSKYFTIKNAPNYWLFASQILIGENKNG